MVYVCLYVDIYSPHTRGDEKTISWSFFLSSTFTWVSGTKLSLLGLCHKRLYLHSHCLCPFILHLACVEAKTTPQ